jgi:DHA1 family bicyclomycin/chloramphenicol resistance-like MFS transporter
MALSYRYLVVMTDLSQQQISAKHQPFTGLPGWLILLGVLTAVGSLSVDMYLPSFPAIVASLDTDAGAVQRTLSMFFIGLGLGQLVYGPLSDRFGRKPPLLFGMALYTIASLACMFATNIWALQWSRLLQALGGCAGIIIPRAAIRDRCDAHSAARALSLVMLVMGAAPILAPQLGSWILIWFSWRAIFGVLLLFGAVCLFAIGFAMEETVDRATTAPINFGSIFRNYHELLRDRQFLTYSLCGGFGSAGMFAYIAGSPFVFMQLYGISTHLYGWIFGANAVGLIAGSQINARLLGYYSPRQILCRSVFFPFLAGAILLALNLCHFSGLAILLPALFIAIGSLGLMTPNSTALALQHQGARAGAATALMGMLQLGLATLSSSAISMWQTDSELPLAAIIALCGAGAMLMYRLAPRS